MILEVSMSNLVRAGKLLSDLDKAGVNNSFILLIRSLVNKRAPISNRQIKILNNMIYTKRKNDLDKIYREFLFRIT